MKRIITLLLIATTMTVSAQETAEGKYTIENGPLTMTIDAARGAKITSFKLGDKEIIRQAFNIGHIEGNTLFLKGVVSRKKQMVPALTLLWG